MSDHAERGEDEVRGGPGISNPYYDDPEQGADPPARAQPSDRIWTMSEIAQIAGVGYRTLHNWKDRGLFTPSLREAEGSGNASMCTDEDLRKACVLAALRPYLTLDALARFASDHSGETG